MVSIRHIFRNRLVVIFMHLAAWVCIFLFPFFAYRIQVSDQSFFIKEAINTLFLVGLFYLNVFVLIPRFFTLKRIGVYIVCVLGLIIFIAVQQAVVEYRFMTYIMKRPPFLMESKFAGGIAVRSAPLRHFAIGDAGPVSAITPPAGAAGMTDVMYHSDDDSLPVITGVATTLPSDMVVPADDDSLPEIGIATAVSPGMLMHTMDDEEMLEEDRKMLAYRDSMLAHRPRPHWRRTLYRNWRRSAPSVNDSFAITRLAYVNALPARPMRDGIFLMNFFFPEMLRKSGTFALLMLFMSGFIKIAMEWFKSEKQREALKVANLNAELKFLKSQINPHFLFNSLNTIYSLAHRRSPETEHALVKLSTIMRYMIYQSNEDKVPLQTELRYLQDYIDIQRLRMTRNIPVEVTVEGTGGTNLEIAPMLLIPFVENAFKHGISYKEPAYIHIRMHVNGNGVFQLVVRNRIFRQRVAEKGGVGLNNVLKRLSLLYADAHTITVREHGEEFIADLKISLKHDEVFSS